MTSKSTNYSSEKRKWLHYLNATGVRRKPKGPLGEGFFEILYQEQLREIGMPWVEVADVGGCAGNDGWAGMALGFWAADDEVDGGADLLRRVRASLAGNEAWTADSASGGAYVKQTHWPYETQGYTTEIATSWAPVALGGWTGLYAQRVADAFAYMEHTFGTAIDTDKDGVSDAWYYHTNLINGTHNEQGWATANLFAGMARDDRVVTSIYDGELAKRTLSQPHLVSVAPGAPAVLVRRAVFDLDGSNGVDGSTGGTLKLTLRASGTKTVKEAKLTLAVPEGWQRKSHGPGPFTIDVDVSAVTDVVVDLPFVKL